MEKEWKELGKWREQRALLDLSKKTRSGRWRSAGSKDNEDLAKIGKCKRLKKLYNTFGDLEYYKFIWKRDGNIRGDGKIKNRYPLGNDKHDT